MDFTKNTNLSIEEISENKTSGNELKYPIVQPKKHLQIMLFLILLQIL